MPRMNLLSGSRENIVMRSNRRVIDNNDDSRVLFRQRPPFPVVPANGDLGVSAIVLIAAAWSLVWALQQMPSATSSTRGYGFRRSPDDNEGGHVDTSIGVGEKAP